MLRVPLVVQEASTIFVEAEPSRSRAITHSCRSRAIGAGDINHCVEFWADPYTLLQPTALSSHPFRAPKGVRYSISKTFCPKRVSSCKGVNPFPFPSSNYPILTPSVSSPCRECGAKRVKGLLSLLTWSISTGQAGNSGKVPFSAKGQGNSVSEKT